jgi:hypothetical protein
MTDPSVNDDSADVEAHEYWLGSNVAAIFAISDGVLRRPDVDEEIRAHVRAIRNLAAELLEQERRRPPT